MSSLFIYVSLCLLYGGTCYFDFEVRHNLTAERLEAAGLVKRGRANKYAILGFGRVLTWNVKKLGACLRQDNTDQLKEVVCVILQSANIILLQEADNLDLSCLPCNNILKDQYEWPDDEVTDEFKVLVKTKHAKTFSIKNYGSCVTSMVSKKNKLLRESTTDDFKRENIFNTVMQRLRNVAEQHTAKNIHGNQVTERLHRIDGNRYDLPLSTFNNNSFETVDGLDMKPLSLKEVPEQDERFYNKDWVENQAYGPLTSRAHGDTEHKNIKIDLRFHFLNDSLSRPSENVLNTKTNREALNEAIENKENSEAVHTIRLHLADHTHKNTFRGNESEKDAMKSDMKSKEVYTKRPQNSTHSIDKNHASKEEKLKTDETKTTEEQFSSRGKNIDKKLEEEPATGHRGKTESDNFHVASNFSNSSSSGLPKRLTERFQQDNNTEMQEHEKLKERLYKSRERLYNSSFAEQEKTERFHLINNQLNSIDKEIDFLQHDSQNKRFHSNESKVDSISLKSVDGNKTKRFHHENATQSTLDEMISKKSKSVQFSDINYEAEHKQKGYKRSHVRQKKRKFFFSEEKEMKMKDLDLNSIKMHNFIEEVLQEPNMEEESRKYMKNQKSLHKDHKSVLRNHLPHRNKHQAPKKELKKQKQKTDNANKREIKLTHSTVLSRDKVLSHDSERARDGELLRKQEIHSGKNIHYVIMTVKSDLNAGDPFILVNVKLPKNKKDQRECVEKMMSDISNANSESEEKLSVIMMGDFHFDRLSGADRTGELYKILTNLQIDGENYHSPISYHEKDPVTTVYGRRFDNILTTVNLKGNVRTIGPDFPIEPEGIMIPLTLQRLYNNYMVALYTSENDESDSIYGCIKAYQLAGKEELSNTVCKDTWIPSSYISDHLPLNLKIKINVSGRSSPLEMNIASWNIQGDTFKERLMDPLVKKAFFAYLKKLHLAVFHEFPPHDRILDDDELGTNDIVRLKEGDLTTEFGIYINEDIKDGDIDMYVLRKKLKNDDEDDTLDRQNMITTVGLFAPKLVINTEKIRPCFYAVKTSSDEVSSSVDFEKIMNAIDKDVRTRRCDFKLLLASLNLDEKFDLDREIYRDYKFINMKCEMTDGDSKYKYNIPRSRNLADYVIILDKNSNVDFEECKIGLPGDEGKRGIDKLSDFEELTTHYPLSMVLKNKKP